MVYTIGEIVLDIIFKTFDDVKVKPGGSMLNTAISLGRLGINVSHVSSISNDKASDLLIDFLHNNNVQTDLITRDKNIKTSLALAYLNKNNNAEYSFYKDKHTNDKFNIPNIFKNNIIHYGSFFSITPEVHNQIHRFLNKANSCGGINIYDPNFRKPHLPDLPQLMPMIENNFKMANIVKGSDEDFNNIYNIKTGKDAWDLAQTFDISVLFYTKGENGSEVYTKKGFLDIDTPRITTKSTIGAGDTYSAGIIYFLNKTLTNNIGLHDISLKQWGKCANIAHSFASQTCQSFDNYLPVEYCNKHKTVIK